MKGRIIEPSGALFSPATYRDIKQPIRVLSADPAWRFGDNLPGDTRGASKQYLTQSTEEIRATPLPPLALDAILFLWRVASMQADALEVVDTWGHEAWCRKHHRQRDRQLHRALICDCGKGFTVKTDWTWNKLTKNGLKWFGMGHYSRASKESVILATRGKFKVATKNIRDTFEAKVPVDPVTGEYIHSGKPKEFYGLVEELTGGTGPYCEMNARAYRDNWICCGNELPKQKPIILAANLL